MSTKPQIRTFIAALFIKSKKKWKQPMSINKRMRFFLNVHIMKSYIIKKKNKLLISSTTWLTLTDIVRERNLMQKRHPL